MPFVLDNVAKGLPATWTILWFHGIDNQEFAENVVRYGDHGGRIQCVLLPIHNLTYADYNTLWMTRDIYRYIPTETFLVFQADTLILSPDKLHPFMKYAYVGAPWRSPIPYLDRTVSVGNGGLSLRKKSQMLAILDAVPFDPTVFEDVYFAYGCLTLNVDVPTREEAMHFSAETLYDPHIQPFGIHKPWAHLHPDDMNHLLSMFPAVGNLMRLQL